MCASWQSPASRRRSRRAAGRRDAAPLHPACPPSGACSLCLRRVVIGLPPSATYHLRLSPFPVVPQVFVAAKRQLGEVLSAFEFLDSESLAITLGHLPGARDPLPACQVREL